MKKLLANENFPLQTSLLLRKSGYDVVCVGENFSGITDNEVMDIAIQEERLILTFDRDYGELIFKYGYKPEKGVLYFRLTDVPSGENLFDLVSGLFNNSKLIFDGCLTVYMDNGQFRQRKF